MILSLTAFFERKRERLEQRSRTEGMNYSTCVSLNMYIYSWDKIETVRVISKPQADKTSLESSARS